MRVTAAFLALLILLAIPSTPGAPGGSGYKLLHELPLAGVKDWDYLTFDPDSGLLYISSDTGAVAFDVDAAKAVANIPDPPFTHGVGFVHGIAIAREFNRGFISHEVPPSNIIFDLKTLKQTGVVKTDPGPDAIVYDPASKRVFTFNSKSAGVHDATVVDAANAKNVGAIPLPGSPESVVVDGIGHLWVNIASKNELSQIDTKTLKITATWPVAPCQEPSGLAIDVAHRRLFLGCDNNLMAMVDADTGKVLGTVPIGNGVDADRFDPGTGYAFASCGDGTLTIAHEDSPDKLTLVEHLPTRASGRTMEIDPKTHRLFIVVAQYQKGRPPASPDNPHRYQVIVPGSARLLVYGR